MKLKNEDRSVKGVVSNLNIRLHGLIAEDLAKMGQDINKLSNLLELESRTLKNKMNADNYDSNNLTSLSAKRMAELAYLAGYQIEFNKITH